MYPKKSSLYLILIIIITLLITVSVSVNFFYIYSPDKNDMEDILKKVIVISLFIIVFLFLAIHHFVIKPLQNIIKIISNCYKNGIPIERVSLNSSKEISILANEINKMINTIKYSQDILIDNKNKLKLLLQMSPTAVRIAKNNGEEIVFANNSYLKLLGIELKDLPNKNPKSYYLKESIYKDLLNSLDKNETIENKLLPLNINGSEIWVIASYMNIIYDGEKAVIGWFYDVTDKIQIQKQIEEQKNEFETIFNYSIDGLAIVDLESNFLKFNASFIKMTGFTREELLKTSCLKLTATEDKQISKNAFINVLKKGLVVDFEKNYIIKDKKNIIKH